MLLYYFSHKEKIQNILVKGNIFYFLTEDDDIFMGDG